MLNFKNLLILFFFIGVISHLHASEIKTKNDIYIIPIEIKILFEQLAKK